MFRVHAIPLALTLALFAALSAPAESDSTLPKPLGVRQLSAFDYRGVTLDDGPLKRQFDEVRDYYLRIPNDDLLKGFRKRAGLPAPGVDLGGWYTDDVFHVFGQILSGLSRMYAATGDNACRDKAIYLMTEWAKCIGPDGYFFYSTKPNARHYIYEKTVGGLVDILVYCRDQRAAAHLRRITDWAIRNLDRRRPYGADANEWYTLSENLYRAYLATGDSTYLDFAKLWEYTDYWGAYADERDIFAKGPNTPQINAYHAYSHVNTLSGAGAAYLVTGNRRYLDTLIHAYDYLRASQCFATGGFGPNEQLLPHGELMNAMAETHNTFETQCGTWAVDKLSKYLLTATGDGRFGDWVEQVTINGIGASIPISADGRVFYYSDYNPSGASKQNIGFGWSCCTGTRPMAVADFHDLIYFKDSGSLYVNLYTPSTVQWNRADGAVGVKQSTRFPEEDTSNFVVSTLRPSRFALKLRVPGWLSAPMTIQLNGKKYDARRDARGWMVIQRTWTAGDRVSIRLPRALKLSYLNPGKPFPAAITYGPVVMAARKVGKGFRKPGEVAALAQLSSLTPSPGEPLTFRSAANPDSLVRPFYAFKEGEPYVLYLDPSRANVISHRDVTFTPAWNDAGSQHFINVAGATAETSFEGSGIRWLGWKFDDAGRAEVRIDGKVVGVVDQFGPGRSLPFDWRFTGLGPGRHQIVVKVLAEKDPESTNRFINVAGFEILP